MILADCKPGTKVTWMFDEGCMGNQPVAGIVLHAAKTMVYVRSERGFKGWTFPCRLNLRTWEPERSDGTVPADTAAFLTYNPEVDDKAPRYRKWVREF